MSTHAPDTPNDDKNNDKNNGDNSDNLDAVKQMVALLLAGLSKSSRFGDERAIIGGTLLATHHAVMLYLLVQYKYHGGRPQYEAARRMMTALADSFRDELMTSITEFEQMIETGEMSALVNIDIKGPAM